MLRSELPEDDASHEGGYGYVWRRPKHRASREEALRASARIRNPGRRDKDYLLRVQRRRILGEWLCSVPTDARVLDVGGRHQPWRELLPGCSSYVALDPVPEGLVDVVGVGDDLPFPDGTFDVVLCTQALGYAERPRRLCAEAHRVLVSGGTLVLSAPALLPRYHDCRWLFMPEGLASLLAPFRDVEIVPEGDSLRSLIRLFLHFLETYVRSERIRGLLRRFVYPLCNTAGSALAGLTPGRTEFVGNYCCRATK